MTVFRVDLTMLDELVSEMSAFGARFAETHAEVDARMRALAGHWSGAAESAQSGAQAQWSAGAAQMREALAQLRSVAATAHGNYGTAASANRSTWAC